MDNLLRPIVEIYPKLFIQKQKIPTFVEMYTKTSDDVVVVCVKVSDTWFYLFR